MCVCACVCVCVSQLSPNLDTLACILIFPGLFCPFLPLPPLCRTDQVVLIPAHFPLAQLFRFQRTLSFAST